MDGERALAHSAQLVPFCERCVNLLRRLWAVSEELTGVGISGRLMRQTGADVTRRATLGALDAVVSRLLSPAGPSSVYCWSSSPWLRIFGDGDVAVWSTRRAE